MRLTLTNGRVFTIKVKYNTIPKETIKHDEFGRLVYTSWDEHNTQVTVEETFDKPNAKPESTHIYKGFAYCSYKDQFSRKQGRELAYYNAVSSMLADGKISSDESMEMDTFKLNEWNCKVEGEE